MCASSTTRCSASRPMARRSNRRSRRREVLARLQGLDDHAAQGSALVRWRAVHRGRHPVLVQGRPADQGPDAGAAGLDQECRRHAGQGRESRRLHHPFHLQRTGDAVPDRRRERGWRRPHLRDVPARALPEEIPSGLHAEGRSRPHGAGGGVQDLDGVVRDARNAPPENPERPTMAAWMPVTRVSDPVFTLRRNPYFVGVDPAGNQLPYIDEVRFTYFADVQALNLQAIAGNFDMQERHIQMTNYPVLQGAGEERQVPRHHLADLRRLGCGDRVQPDLQGRSGDRQADGDQGFPDRVVVSRSTATRSGNRCSWVWARAGRRCRRRGIRIFPARNGRRNTPSSIPTKPTRCSTRLA